MKSCLQNDIRAINMNDHVSVLAGLLKFTQFYLWTFQALNEAHDSGILHKDIKSANVYFNTEGRVLLGDLGTVELVAHGYSATAAGTPDHMDLAASTVELMSHRLVDKDKSQAQKAITCGNKCYDDISVYKRWESAFQHPRDNAVVVRLLDVLLAPHSAHADLVSHSSR